MEEDLKRAGERLHHCRASFMKDAAMGEKLGGETVWQGVIAVFGIKGHPQAEKCSARSSPLERITTRRHYAVLHIPPGDSPEKAVRAAIVQDHKSGK
jgi:hypothetical protein